MHKKYWAHKKNHDRLIAQNNEMLPSEGGLFRRYKNPVLTAKHTPLFWRYDLDARSNPFFLERMGINSVYNAGAIKLDGKYVLLARIEGKDRKSFFGVAESDKPTEGFRFRPLPAQIPAADTEELNVGDMRLTQHEDGWIYGIFRTVRRDRASFSLSGTVSSVGIARTHDLSVWERLPDLRTADGRPRRDAVLHPEFVGGRYALYTRSADGFADPPGEEGIRIGYCDSMTDARLSDERVVSFRRPVSVAETVNAEGAVPIKTEHGWIHIAQGVRETVAGRRYVLYAYATALSDPANVIAEPAGYLLAPVHSERMGDVEGSLSAMGAIRDYDGTIYLYYASAETRVHVASASVDRLCDFVFNTPEDPGSAALCGEQRMRMIRRNLELMNAEESGGSQ